jgi:AcrR family transcriptional regulator
MPRALKSETPETDSLRERKRRETLQRIADVGLKLFVARGYEETTLDAIAAEAGISRRTFFYYYKSKEEILHAWQGKGLVAALHTAMLEESPDQAPLVAVRHCLLNLASRFEDKDSIVIDRLFQSTESLRARKHATYIQMEELLFDALLGLYPGPRRRTSLRVVAMVSMGTWRLALGVWREERGKRPFAECLRLQFETLEEEI